MSSQCITVVLKRRHLQLPGSSIPFHQPSSSSFTLTGRAELFIKQTSSLSAIDFWPTCVFRNGPLPVVLLPALPHLCHHDFQRLNLAAQTYSALSSLSSDKIYVGVPCLRSHRRSFPLVILRIQSFPF